MKKILAALLACTLTAAMLTGCGSAADDGAGSQDQDVSADISTPSDTDAETGDEAGAEGDDAQSASDGEQSGQSAGLTVKDGVLTMATNAYFPPYEYYEGNDIVGIDAEIAKAVADKLGLELKIEDMEFGSIIIAVTQGRADMGLAGMTVTEERLESVNFTDSYATGIQVVIVTEDSDIEGIDDLNGKKIGTQLGTTGDQYSKQDFGEENVESYNKGADAVMALTQGKVDAVIIDNQPALAFVESTEGLKILETEYASRTMRQQYPKTMTLLQKQLTMRLRSSRQTERFSLLLINIL